jgi:hypothetical protein
MRHGGFYFFVVMQGGAPLGTPCQRLNSASAVPEAAGTPQMPTPSLGTRSSHGMPTPSLGIRSSHGMATRRQSGVVPARRKYYDDEGEVSLELSPAICPVDTLGPPTPFPDNGEPPFLLHCHIHTRTCACFIHVSIYGVKGGPIHVISQVLCMHSRSN